MSYPGPGSSWGTPEDGQNSGPYTGGGQPDSAGGYANSGNSDPTTHYGAYGDQGGTGQYGESGTGGYGNQPEQYGTQPGQPDPYGSQPGQYGATPYGAGQPGGYPPAAGGGGGGFGGGTPPQPPYGGPPAPGSGGSGNNRMPLIIGIVVALLIAGGLIAFLVTRGGNDTKNNAKSPPPTHSGSQVITTPTTPDVDPAPDTGSVSSPPSGISESDARDTVNQYLDDINTQDDTDAGTLICASKLTAWKSTIHDASKGGDFTIKVVSKKINSVTQTSDGYDVDTTISAQALSGGSAKPISVTFVIIDESGPKICDEKT